MNMYFDSQSSFLRIILLWAGLLAIVLFLFLPGAVPVSAAENKGWIEARVTVPLGFEEHVIVTIINEKTGEEFAGRLMQKNGYVSRFQVPEGKYAFDGAFLENGDFRYNTVLTNGAEKFEISSSNSTAQLLSLETTFNEAFEGVNSISPTDPDEVEETEPSVTEPEEPTDDYLANYWRKILWTLIATAVFIGIVFIGAYFYRRHLELQ